jgi:hypothetical protein
MVGKLWGQSGVQLLLQLTVVKVAVYGAERAVIDVDIPPMASWQYSPRMYSSGPASQFGLASGSRQMPPFSSE